MSDLSEAEEVWLNAVGNYKDKLEAYVLWLGGGWGDYVKIWNWVAYEDYDGYPYWNAFHAATRFFDAIKNPPAPKPFNVQTERRRMKELRAMIDGLMR